MKGTATCKSGEDRLNAEKCKIDKGFNDGNRNDMRFDLSKVPHLNNCYKDFDDQYDTEKAICAPGDVVDEKLKAAEAEFQKHRSFFESEILKKYQDASKHPDTYDDNAKADSYWDVDSGTFWTWQGPYAISETCEAMKKDDIGGQFVYAIGQDSESLTHIKAYQECMKEWVK
jgi:GH18 family chitinase